MKTYEITEEQIREAHGAACSQWKSQIESWWPDSFKYKLEVGKWYKSKDFNRLIFCLTKIEEGVCIGYGSDEGNSWLVNERIMKTSRAIPATDKEVEEMLIKEAVKRGYVGGMLVKSSLSGSTYKLHNTPFEYNPSNGKFRLGSVCIFKDGKWAEIIKEEPSKEMTIEEIESKLGHKIKIVK